MCPYPWRDPAGRIAGEVLVHLRPRFQRFAAMSTVGDFKSPFYFQNPDAEWTAARPFVIAFRTYAENNVRAAQKFAALPKRDQESAIPVCADQEFFQVRIPFCGRTVLERREKQGAAQNLGAGLEFLDCFHRSSSHQSNTFHRAVEATAHVGKLNGLTTHEDPRTGTPLWNAKLLGAMPRTTYCQLRIGLRLSLVPKRAPAYAYPGSPFQP